MAYRHPLGGSPATVPGPDGKRLGGTSRLGRNRLLLVVLPAALFGGLLVVAGSAVPAAAAGALPSTCTGTLGGVLLSGGSGQAARTGTGFADPLAAEVVDTGGCPLNEVDVEFVAPTSGAGATFPGAATTATVTTGSDGIATAPNLTTNQVSGSYTVVAQVANTSYQVSFELDNTTSGVASLVGVSSGNDQSAQVGQQFALPLAVNVSDSYGAAVADASVNFTVVPTDGAQASFVGGGSAASAQTNGLGTATSPLLVAGSTTGTFTVQASVTGVSKLVTFTLTDRAAAAYAIAAGVGTIPGGAGRHRFCRASSRHSDGLQRQPCSRDAGHLQRPEQRAQRGVRRPRRHCCRHHHFEGCGRGAHFFGRPGAGRLHSHCPGGRPDQRGHVRLG